MIKYAKNPLELAFPVPNGAYEVLLTVNADEDTEFDVYSQSRRYAARNVRIKKGESRDICFTVNVCDRSFYNTEPEKYDGVHIYVACDGAVRITASVSPADVPTVYICGDSTVTDQAINFPYNPQSTYCGWGQMFPMLTDLGIVVENQAQSGSCTTQFIENNWKAFKDKIKKGDILIAEFGHNDQKIAQLDPYGGYSANLRYFIDYARAKGAYPVINSPINRIIFENDGSLKNLLGDYRNAAKKVCEETNTPFVDLWQRTTDYFVKAGCVKSWDFFFGDENGRDYTHTNDFGGELIAKMFAQEVLKNRIEPLCSHIKPELTATEQVYADPGDKADMSKELEHIKTIGLVNIDADI